MKYIDNILYFWIQNTYNSIINFYNKKNYSIIIELQSKYERNFLSYEISKWILCYNIKNNYSCNKCNSCVLMKYNKNPDYHHINFDKYNNNFDIISFINIINYKSIYKNIVIYVSNIEYANNKFINLLLKAIENNKSNIFFIFSCKNFNNLNNNLISRCILWNLHYLDNKFLINYIDNIFYKLNKIEKSVLLYLSNYSLIKLIEIINKKFIENRNNLFELINLSVLNKNFFLLFKYFINNNNLYLNKLLIIFIIDIIKYKLNINSLINKDQKKLIKKMSFIIKNKLIYKILENWILYNHYSLYNKNINNNILLIYNIFFLNKIFVVI